MNEGIKRTPLTKEESILHYIELVLLNNQSISFYQDWKVLVDDGWQCNEMIDRGNMIFYKFFKLDTTYKYMVHYLHYLK